MAKPVMSPQPPDLSIPALLPYIHSQPRRGEKSATWFPIVVINLYRDPQFVNSTTNLHLPRGTGGKKKKVGQF